MQGMPIFKMPRRLFLDTSFEFFATFNPGLRIWDFVSAKF